jgi:glutamate synthase domain-containing protein 1
VNTAHHTATPAALSDESTAPLARPPGKQGLYDPSFEHDACGVGFVVDMKGRKSHKIVADALQVLTNLDHRGAAGSEPTTGDGAGIHVQIPVKFFYDQVRRTGHEPDTSKLIAVGQVFLPRTDFGAQEACRTIVETEVLRMGHYIYGWRHVPSDISVLGEKALATRPEIEQIKPVPTDAELKSQAIYNVNSYIAKIKASDKNVGKS